MAISELLMRKILLQAHFSLTCQSMPNASDVLTVLGDEAFQRYCKVQDEMKALWHEASR